MQPNMDNILSTIYSTPSPPVTRTRPMQVLCVGPSRSGTDSLRSALLELGYPRVHHGYSTISQSWQKPLISRLLRKKYRSGSEDGSVQFTAEEFDQLYGEYDACTDISAAVFAAELIAAYPDAGVILNRRADVDRWHASVLGTFGIMEKSWSHWFTSWFCADLYWSRRLVFREILPWFYRGDYKANGKWVYREHCAMVRGLVPKERLLEWGPEDGWQPLCQFLGKDVPKTEFPKGNMPEDFATKLQEGHGRNRRRAYRNIAITGTILVAVVSGIAFRAGLEDFKDTAFAFVRTKMVKL